MGAIECFAALLKKKEALKVTRGEIRQKLLDSYGIDYDFKTYTGKWTMELALYIAHKFYAKHENRLTDRQGREVALLLMDYVTAKDEADARAIKPPFALNYAKAVGLVAEDQNDV